MKDQAVARSGVRVTSWGRTDKIILVMSTIALVVGVAICRLPDPVEARMRVIQEEYSQDRELDAQAHRAPMEASVESLRNDVEEALAEARRAAQDISSPHWSHPTSWTRLHDAFCRLDALLTTGAPLPQAWERETQERETQLSVLVRKFDEDLKKILDDADKKASSTDARQPDGLPRVKEILPEDRSGWGVWCWPTAGPFANQGSWLMWGDPPRGYWTASKVEAEACAAKISNASLKAEARRRGGTWVCEPNDG